MAHGFGVFGHLRRGWYSGRDFLGSWFWGVWSFVEGKAERQDLRPAGQSLLIQS